MGELTDFFEALRAGLQAAMPSRVVTRDFKDFAQRRKADLQAGVVTVIAQGEKGYANYLGRAAQLGTVGAILIGQLQVAEQDPPHAVEDAEFVLAEEIKTFCINPGGALGGLVMTSFRQSGQMDHPFGWIAVELEIET